MGFKKMSRSLDFADFALAFNVFGGMKVLPKAAG
jgi:hypothetical protein